MVEASDLIKIELFGVFLKKQLEELAAVTEKKKYKKKEMVYQQGDRANHLYIITKGLVSLVEFQPGDKVGIVFEERGRGEIFGCASFMKPRNHTLTAMCVEDSEILVIETDPLIDLFEQDPEVGYKFIKNINQIYFDLYKFAKRQLHEMMKIPAIVTALPT
ncbi:Crp/Fnr family transcriptional regulator [Thermodesulfobacteriota bacterium]